VPGAAPKGRTKGPASGKRAVVIAAEEEPLLSGPPVPDENSREVDGANTDAADEGIMELKKWVRPAKDLSHVKRKS
jgi:hypothetical protein